MLGPQTDAARGRPEFVHLKSDLQAERAALRARFERTGDAPALLRDHRRLVDRVLREMWRRMPMPENLALLAVGGYGRGELYPHSDIDVLVLLPGEPSPDVAGKLEELIGRLWDTGLETGHSVRTVADCLGEAAKDITVRTSLLEARLLAGSRALFREFEQATRTHFDVPAFFKAKRLEQEQRH